jgi:hypothetical protein
MPARSGWWLSIPMPGRVPRRDSPHSEHATPGGSPKVAAAGGGKNRLELHAGETGAPWPQGVRAVRGSAYAFRRG